MAGARFWVEVEHGSFRFGSGLSDFSDAWSLVLVRSARPCERCAKNKDPLAVPVHPRCNCRSELVKTQ